MAADGVEIDDVEKSPSRAGFVVLSTTVAVVAATPAAPPIDDDPATVNSPDDPGTVAVITKLSLPSTEAFTTSFHVASALIKTASRSFMTFLVVWIVGDSAVVPDRASFALTVIDPLPTPALVMVTERAVAVFAPPAG
jgi:hypothetical protein